MKGHNLLYDERKDRVNFIDFGLMRRISECIKECNEDNMLNQRAIAARIIIDRTVYRIWIFR